MRSASRFGTVSLALVFCLMLSGPALATYPLGNEGPVTTEPMAVDLEVNLEYDSYSEGTETTFSASVTTGLFPDLDISLWLPIVSVSPDEGDSESGVGDAEIMFKWQFMKEENGMPGLAVRGVAKLTSGDEEKGLGSGEMDYSLILLGSYKLEPVNLYATLGYTWVGEPPGVDLDNVVSLSLAVEYPLNEKLDLVGRLAGESGQGDEDAPIFILGGASYAINDVLYVDGGIRLGVTDTAPDWSIILGAGFSF
jgi:hypothetical protein